MITSVKEQQILDIIDKWDESGSMDWFDWLDSFEMMEKLNKIILGDGDIAAGFIDAMEEFKQEAAEGLWDKRVNEGFYVDTSAEDYADAMREDWVALRIEQ